MHKIPACVQVFARNLPMRKNGTPDQRSVEWKCFKLYEQSQFGRKRLQTLREWAAEPYNNRLR
jgi:hypothetical protein